jgi:hypothetical protein
VATVRAGQLDRVADRPVRAKIITEPAQPLSLLGVGPDDRIPPTPELPDMHVSLLRPAIEVAIAHAAFISRVADPPLVGRESLRRPAPRTERLPGKTPRIDATKSQSGVFVAVVMSRGDISGLSGKPRRGDRTDYCGEQHPHTRAVFSASQSGLGDEPLAIGVGILDHGPHGPHGKRQGIGGVCPYSLPCVRCAPWFRSASRIGSDGGDLGRRGHTRAASVSERTAHRQRHLRLPNGRGSVDPRPGSSSGCLPFISQGMLHVLT